MKAKTIPKTNLSPIRRKSSPKPYVSCLFRKNRRLSLRFALDFQDSAVILVFDFESSNKGNLRKDPLPMSNTARNAALGLLLGVTAAIAAPADDGSSLWLRTPIPDKAAYRMDTDKPISATMNIVLSELSRFRQRNWAVATDKHRNDLGNEGFEIRIMNDTVKIHAQTDIGLLYGA